ncbi:MAG: hypothetical protein ABJH07_10530 [Sedimentitalea sp.]|uniref:hypothetical protein n=1 Tax=Sedimentitalea sp. TaxID=2048915 RepID=UPI0032663D3B
MSLTDIQDDFVKRFIVMADGGDAADIDDVLLRLNNVKVPAGATPAEAKDISEQIALARELVRDAGVPLAVDQASIATGGAEQLVLEISDRIKKTGEEAKALLKRADGLEESLDAEVPSEERDKIKSTAAQIAGPLVDATDPEVVTAARAEIEKQELLAASLNEAAEQGRQKRKQEAEELREKLGKLTVPDGADGTERKTAETLAAKLDDLAEIPTAVDLVSATENVNALEQYLDELKKTLATRKQKAQDLRNQVAKLVPPKDAEMSERTEAENLRIISDDLADTPTTDELAQAVSDVAALTRYLDDLDLKLKERRERFAKVAPLLARLAADAPKLMPHKRAPAGGDALKIQEHAKQLLAKSQHLLDWSKVTDWANVDLTNLDQACGELERRMDDLNGAIVEKISDIDKVVQAAKTCIGAPKGRKFSNVQIAAFEQLITVQTSKTDADLDQADTVISALGEQVTQLNKLSVALAVKEARIGAVTEPKEADLSAKEKAALKAAKKAAKDALDKVDEL